MKNLVPILLALTICFCTNKKQLNEDKANPGTVSNKQKESGEKLVSKQNIQNYNIVLGTFPTTPIEIDGCGCALFLSKQDLLNNNYIYADAGNIACVKINGKLQLLDLKEYDKKTNTYLYSNKHVTIKVAHVKSTPSLVEETTNVEMLLTIDKGTDRLQKKVIGYCGC